MGQKQYELSNHLGNVLAVITDAKFWDAQKNAYLAVVVSATDYYPFGLAMDGRSYSSDAYRYGFNKQERDDDFLEGAVEFKYRIHNPKIGKFLSVDPLASEYPWNSTYAFAENRVIDGRDVEGREWDCVVDDLGNVIGISLNVTLEIDNDVEISESQLQAYRDAVAHTFNQVFYQSSNGTITGNITFNGGDKSKAIIPELIISKGRFRSDGLFEEGATTYERASVSYNMRTGANTSGVKSLEQFGLDAVHELFHTLRLSHPFEQTQGKDTELIFSGFKEFERYGQVRDFETYSSTKNTDPLISFNIMNYSIIAIDGELLHNKWQDSPANRLTTDQISWVTKEIQRQIKHGPFKYNDFNDANYYGERYTFYEEEPWGETIEKKD